MSVFVGGIGGSVERTGVEFESRMLFILTGRARVGKPRLAA